MDTWLLITSLIILDIVMLLYSLHLDRLISKGHSKAQNPKNYFLLVFVFFLTAGATAQETYPKITGYASFTHPIATLDREGIKANFSDSYKVVFPVGLNLMKSERFGFSFEVSPAIKSDSNGTKVSSVLFHPGAVFRFDKGFGMAGRLAFDTSGRFGFTPVFNKTLLKKDTHNYWIAVPFPVRFGDDQPTSIGAGLQWGISF